MYFSSLAALLLSSPMMLAPSHIRLHEDINASERFPADYDANELLFLLKVDIEGLVPV